MNDRWHEPIQRHLAGLASAEEAAALHQALKDDAELRALYLDYANLDVALHTAALLERGSTESALIAPAGEPAGVARTIWFQAPWLRVAAVLAILGVVAWLLWPVTPETGLMLASADAAVKVERQGRTLLLPVGAALRVGDVIVSEAAGIVVSYPEEETRLELAPATRLEVLPHRAGKQLRLHAGALSAEVAPQPEGRPMRLFSPGAEAVVLGTRFTLSAEASGQELAVQKGAVRVNRAASRDSILVSAAERVNLVAGELATVAVKVAESSPWRRGSAMSFDFDADGAWPYLRAGRATAGPEEAAATGRCLAAELFRGENPQLKFGVSLRARCRVGADATLRVRYWAGPEVRNVMVNVYAEGTRGYLAQLSSPEHGRWAEWTVPLSSLRAAWPDANGQHPPLAPGAEVRTVSLSTARSGDSPRLYFDDLVIEPVSPP